MGLGLGCGGTSVGCLLRWIQAGCPRRRTNWPEVGVPNRGTIVSCEPKMASGLGCPRQRAKWARGWVSPNEPRWLQAGESPAEDKMGQRLGSPQDNCPLRTKRASGWGVPSRGPSGPEVGESPGRVRCAPRGRQAGVSPAEGQVGQRLGSPQDKCPLRTKWASGWGVPSRGPSGPEVGGPPGQVSVARQEGVRLGCPRQRVKRARG